ncbi:neuroglian-like isoform X2 [Crassostrea virginica]
MELEEHMLFVLLANILLGANSLHLSPMISSVFQSEYFLNDSCDLSLRCHGINDVISYSWYQNGSQIKGNKEIVANKDTGELLISKNCTYDLLGIFYCIAENKYGSTVSPFVKISEPVLNSFDLTHRLDVVVCTENEHCQLNCTGKPICEPHAACELTWYQGSGTQDSISSSERTAIDLEGNLHFLNVSEISGNKKYACGIWNERMNTLRQGDLITLIINDSTTAPLLRAIYHSRSKALLGKSAVLECIFSGILVSEIKWENPNGYYITTNDKYRIGPYGRQLQVMNVTYNDEGNYSCHVNNLTQTPFLNVTSPPIFPENNSSFLTKTINISTDDAVNLNCNAVSLPTENAPVVTRWMKNGILISSFQDFEIQLLDNNSVLRIYRAHLEKGGAFQCVAENSEGIAVANFLIELENVKGKSTTIGPKQGKENQPYGNGNKLMIKMISSVVVGLVALVTLFVIIRKRISQRNKSWKTETEVNTNIYTLPSEEFDEHQRRSDEEIHLEEMYSTVEEASFNHKTQCIEDNVDSNTEAEDLGEYDVLRGKRKNEEARQSDNIYDRTNNVVSEIYDSTSTQPVDNVYNMTPEINTLD